MSETVACPRPNCEQNGFANPGELAAHLITDHLMAGSAALLLARQTAGEVRAPVPATPIPPQPIPAAPTRTEARPMTCKNCGGDHRSDNAICPKRAGTKAGGGGSVAAPSAAKRKAITRRHPLPPKKGTKAAGNGLVSEIEALGAVAAALTALDAEQQRNVLGCVCRLLAIDASKLAA